MRAESEQQQSSRSSSRLRFDPSSVAYTFESEQLEQRHISHLLDQGLYDQEARLLNKKGAELLQEGLHERAKSFLETAEKILESAASSGRIVDHCLVTSVLHNLACYHQLTWNLDCCANYLEALLFNLNSELQAINGASLAAQQSSALTSELAFYYLRFCAVNSQLKRHDAALISAKKASALLRISVQQLMRMAEASHLGLQPRSREILQELSHLKGNTDGLQIEDLLFMAKRALYNWKRRRGQEYYESLSQYSIVQVMQLRPRGEIQFDRPGEDLTYPKLLERVLVEATCYLALATELRLLAVRQYSTVEQASEFKQSQSFHLIALAIMLRFLPTEIPFLKHALTSYSHHYRSQLEECPCFLASTDLLSPILDSPLVQSNDHLQVYVKASLATQQQFAKLDSYYYNESEHNRGNKGKKSSSRQKDIAKRACLTSKQSAQKTPVGTSPSRLSPLRSRLSKRADKHVTSARGSITKITSPNHQKITSVLDEYFSPECNRKKLLSKGSKNKQNNDRITKLTSPIAWRGTNLSNKPALSRGKAQSKLQGIKSPGKRPQVLPCKSKKKAGSIHYYY